MCFLQLFKCSRLLLFHWTLRLPRGTCQIIINQSKYTYTHYLHAPAASSNCMYMRVWAHMRGMFTFISVVLSYSSCVSIIGISVMSSAAGDNKLVEEPIISRWQAGGSGLSTCHYLHIDISKSCDRPFLRLPWQATMINPDREREREREEGRKTWTGARVSPHTLPRTFVHTHCRSMQVQIHKWQLFLFQNI